MIQATGYDSYGQPLSEICPALWRDTYTRHNAAIKVTRTVTSLHHSSVSRAWCRPASCWSTGWARAGRGCVSSWDTRSLETIQLIKTLFDMNTAGAGPRDGVPAREQDGDRGDDAGQDRGLRRVPARRQGGAALRGEDHRHGGALHRDTGCREILAFLLLLEINLLFHGMPLIKMYQTKLKY